MTQIVAGSPGDIEVTYSDPYSAGTVLSGGMRCNGNPMQCFEPRGGNTWSMGGEGGPPPLPRTSHGAHDKLEHPITVPSLARLQSSFPIYADVRIPNDVTHALQAQVQQNHTLGLVLAWVGLQTFPSTNQLQHAVPTMATATFRQRIKRTYETGACTCTALNHPPTTHVTSVVLIYDHVDV